MSREAVVRLATHTQVLVFQVFIHALVGAFPAQTGFLDATEGGGRVGNQAFVDTYHAAFQRFGHAPATVDVVAVEIGGQTVRGVVGDANGFAQGFEVEFIEIQSLEDFIEASDLQDGEAADADALPDLRATDIPDTLNIAQWEKRRRGDSPKDPEDTPSPDADPDDKDDGEKA